MEDHNLTNQSVRNLGSDVQHVHNLEEARLFHVVQFMKVGSRKNLRIN